MNGLLRRSVILAALLFATPVVCANGQQSASGPNAAEDEIDVLFDGSSLDHFRGYKQSDIGKGWKIDGDSLMFDGSGGGDIITKNTYQDFELTFDWKVSKGANSGVMYRVSLGDNAPYFSGPEYQVLDDDNHGDGGNEKTSAAALYGLYKAADKTLKPVGEWNTAKIVLQGPKVEHWLNGTKVVDADLSSDDWKQRVENSKFKTWEKFGRNKSGHICFQDHGDKVWFRNIKVRKLDSN